MKLYLTIIRAENDGTFKSSIQEAVYRQEPKPYFRYTKKGTIYYKTFSTIDEAKKFTEYIKGE